MTQGRDARGPSRRQDAVVQSVRDLAVAGGAVLIVILLIWGYAGVWPPMVVIESGSMMHQPNDSALGVIDTGDLTLVKAMGSDGQIRTYTQSRATGYQTYGNLGDVVIYAMNGDFGQTPIIHRAITRVVLNASTQSSLDFPELTPPVYNVVTGPVSLGLIRTFHVDGPVGRDIEIVVAAETLINNMGANLHGGFLTKGDNNDRIDQVSLFVTTPGHGTKYVEPVMFEWVLGVARQELPWFGAIKLWVGGNKDPVPGNSVTLLVVALALIVTVPFGVEVAWNRYGDRVVDRIPAKWRAGWHRFFDKWPGGKRRQAIRREREAERAAEAARLHREERRHRKRDGQ